MSAGATLHYYPDIFTVANLEKAKEIILTDEGPGADTTTRWERETPYLIDLMRAEFPLAADTLVLDYGCGIGRMAKAMIEAFGCKVIGIDISASMRALASDYVASDRFIVLSPGQWQMLQAEGLRAQAAIAVWVLQHCLAPADDIARIHTSLAPGGKAFVLNMPKRAVPAIASAADQTGSFVWASDGVDVAALLRARFAVEAHGVPDQSRIPNMADAGGYWMRLLAEGAGYASVQVPSRGAPSRPYSAT